MADYTTPPRPTQVNYDETRVPPYALPEPLCGASGNPITSAEAWNERRGELLELFAREMYGRTPRHARAAISERSRDERALAGLATRLELEVSVFFEQASEPRPLSIELVVWLPNTSGPHPAFLGLNFAGNHTLHPEPGVRVTERWVPAYPELGQGGHTASEVSRGLHAKRWPLELLMARGYALATFYAGDLAPDYPEGTRANAARMGVDRDAADAPGAIALWAFGLSRALDALERLPAIDARRVAVIGHSRHGKAALWAAANDPRFALVAANSSGRGGAALSRRRLGERVRDLNARFSHWFAPSFRRYSDDEQALPVDQHQLLALIAPRPLALGTAELDLWCDPRGELLACLAARPVYELFGRSGPPAAAEAQLALGAPLGDCLRYHRRAGDHDLTKLDWWHYLAHADRWLGGLAP